MESFFLAGIDLKEATSGYRFAPPCGNPKKSIVRVAHLIFSTAAESTSSLSHSPNALGVLSQRATLVGLITLGVSTKLFHVKAKRKTAPKGAVFILVAGTGLEPATSGL